jgi:hypothetical protein
MDKQTIINDLVARIPYGVVVNCTDGDVQIISVDFEMGYDNPEFWYDGPGSNINFDDDNIKPYLFPLSSMTEEQLKEMQEIIGNPNEACISVKTSGLELWLNSIDTDPTIWLDTIFEVQNWLNKNHFDYRGLIPAGAAIDATGKGIYPYVKKETIEDDSKKFPYPIGSRVKIKIANKDRFATIVGISYNTFGNKQYEIIIDNDNPLVKIHYPTELMTLVE